MSVLVRSSNDAVKSTPLNVPPAPLPFPVQTKSCWKGIERLASSWQCRTDEFSMINHCRYKLFCNAWWYNKCIYIPSSWIITQFFKYNILLLSQLYVAIIDTIYYTPVNGIHFLTLTISFSFGCETFSQKCRIVPLFVEIVEERKNNNEIYTRPIVLII